MTLPEPEPQPRQVSVRGPLSDMMEMGTVSISSRPSQSRDMPKSNWKTREGRPKGHAPAEGPWALTQYQCEHSWQAKACPFFPPGEADP